DGRTTIVVENYSQLLDTPAMVYNLEVADGHTYFVEDGQGAQTAIWVHNNCALSKAVNLPAWKKVGIKIEHVVSGHTAGGARVLANSAKSLFPSGMTATQIERVVRQAYRNAKRIKTQGDRILLRGTSAGIEIEMWLDRVKKIITTAYPI
ncbi:MAG: polymorphic toxin-type HINT domain-containing protein, partial [Planctomycetia bacterium]|nr:polymorphic toxin-type HINT domain-containing protein [Planctomycetia bacterium]